MTGVRLKTLRDIGLALGTKSRALEALRMTQNGQADAVNRSLRSRGFINSDTATLPINIHPKVAKLMDARASKILSGAD